MGTDDCALMMPVIRFGFHFDPAIAVGTTLTAVVFTSPSGAYQHIKMKNVEKETALLTGYSGILGVIIGSIVFGYIKNYGKIIDLIIGITFIIVYIRMLWERIFSKKQGAQGKEMLSNPLSKTILGSVIGALTGIIGLGGGYALVPSFIYFLKTPVKLAIGTQWLLLFGWYW